MKELEIIKEYYKNILIGVEDYFDLGIVKFKNKISIHYYYRDHFYFNTIYNPKFYDSRYFWVKIKP